MHPEHHGSKVTTVDLEEAGHIASEVKKQGMTNVCTQLGFVFFCLTQSGLLIQGMVPPMVNMGLPSSVNLTETVSPRTISQVVHLDFVKLTIRVITRNKPIL